MNQEKFLEAGLDYEDALLRMRGRKDLFDRLVQAFLKDKHYEAMLVAIANRDADVAFHNAHVLKGTAGNMSMNQLYKDITPLANELREGNFANIEELLKPVAEDYHRLVEVLK